MGILVASVMAEWARKGTLYPLDTMATRLQTARLAEFDTGDGAVKTRHRPVVDDARAMASMLKRPRTLYRGISASMIGAVPTSLVYMPTYEASSACLRALAHTPWGSVLPVAQLASFATGVASSTVRVPTSMLKARLQLGFAKSITEAFALATQNGTALGGLYVGWLATCLLDITYALVQFTSLEWLLGLATAARSRALTSKENAFIGFATGVITATVTEPLDVIKTRLQTQRQKPGGQGLDFGYGGIVDGLVRAVRKEGVLALWRGLLPRLLLKALGSGIWFATYTMVRQALVPGS